MFYRGEIGSYDYLWWGGVGANEYEDIVYDGLFSLIDDLLAILEDAEEVQIADENTFIFMQDNAKCHKAETVLEFLAENRVPLMEWPAQSPDLNPLENLWIEFKERFHKRFIELFSNLSKSMEARYRYGEIMQEVWYSQGMELVEALISSMPERCQAVIDAEGGWTKYWIALVLRQDVFQYNIKHNSNRMACHWDIVHFASLRKLEFHGWARSRDGYCILLVCI